MTDSDRPLAARKLLRDMTEDDLRRTIRECDDEAARVTAGGVHWKAARNLRESCGSELHRREPTRRASSWSTGFAAFSSDCDRQPQRSS